MPAPLAWERQVTGFSRRRDAPVFAHAPGVPIEVVAPQGRIDGVTDVRSDHVVEPPHH